MSVNLQKGQKIDLKKESSSLKRVMVGLGWDEAAPQKKGFFGKKPEEIDCDASALLCVGGKVQGGPDVVYFGNLQHASGSVKHQGDNLTGAGEGDDEQIMVDLDRVPQNFDKVVFVVNIYQAQQRRQHFGLIKNAFIRIVDADTRQELCKYNLSENYDNMTGMIFGELYRYQDTWKFSAVGQGTTDLDLGSLVRRFQ